MESKFASPGSPVTPRPAKLMHSVKKHDNSVAALAYSAVFATAFAFAAWQNGISRIGANRVLVYQYLITLTGVASGIVFFGESLGPEKIIGGGVILLGVYLARR